MNFLHRLAALDTAFVADAKASGLVAAAISRRGLRGTNVAP
jgi:hypothetical protein